MTDPRRRPKRRSRRPALRVGIIITLVVVVAIAVAVGVALWGKHPSAANRGAAASSTSPRSASPSSTTPRVAAQAPASSVASVGTPIPLTAADRAAYDVSKQAADAAAVPYRHAPALSPTLLSIGGLRLRPRHKYVAITLDDGYNFQLPMLELLERYHVRCTTFLIGQWMEGNLGIVKRLHADGFEIANHTWSHVNLTQMTPAQVSSQLTRTQAIISSVTGNQAPYLRPPGGATDPTVKSVASSLGYHIVLWDRSFGDSGRGATPEKLFDNAVTVRGGVKPGDVILCHWGSTVSYEAMKKVLPYLRAQGYEVVTLSALIADSPKTAKP